ncbi:MAG: sugar phosphate permease [Deltaproteobacteria bacterium]|nr:sugar phosphate permease [Deltaproteobacteria bacterium]
MHESQKPGFFYGYVIVVACFLIEACGIGAYVAFGVFFKPLLAEFGWSRATVSGATSLAYLMMGFLGVVAGSLNDRFGPRMVMAVSGVFCGCGYFLLSRLDSVWQLYLLYGLVVGIGLSSVDVIALTVTARWFVRRRGMMTGIIKVGTGVGQLVLPLLASIWIINSGWRHAFAYLGIVVMVFLIGSGLMLRRDPSLKGHVPDGRNNQAPGQTTLLEGGLSPSEAARTPQFWIYCIVNFLVMNCLLIIVLHIVPHASDIGLDAIKAASVVSAIGASSMVGRLLTGALVDRIGTGKVMVACLMLLICSFLWLQVARDAWMLYLFAAIYGAGHGGFFTSISPTVARLFGISSHGVLLGIVLFSGNVGGAIGPVVAGLIFDVARSYQPVFWLMAALCATALVLTPFLKPAVRKG